MTYPPNYNRWPDDLPNPGTQPPYYAPQQPPPPPPRKNNKGKIIAAVIGAALVTLVIVVCAAMFGSDQAKRGEPEAPAATSAKAAAPKASQAQPGAPVRKSAAPVLSSRIKDGTFIVGKDVAAGEYKTLGAAQGIITLCTWTTSKDNSFRTVVDFGAADKEDQPGLVTLKKGQYFKTTGCQPWVRQ